MIGEDWTSGSAPKNWPEDNSLAYRTKGVAMILIERTPAGGLGRSLVIVVEHFPVIARGRRRERPRGLAHARQPACIKNNVWTGRTSALSHPHSFLRILTENTSWGIKKKVHRRDQKRRVKRKRKEGWGNGNVHKGLMWAAFW